MSGIPASWATAATASRSTTTPPGFARLSTKIAFVFGVSARRKCSGLLGSTSEPLQPMRGKLCVNWVIEPPYRFREAMNSSPGSSNVKKARNCAAWPDAAATAARPCSRLATLSSRTATVGLVMRL